MPSFDHVNYSLRPSKTIERLLAFDSIRLLMNALPLENMLYAGFGSIWFVDFHLAHKTLGLRDSVSIEADAIGYARAKFNKPFSTCGIYHGFSSAVIPKLLKSAAYKHRPWCLWLDYDYEFRKDVADEVRFCIENLPENSIFLITFSGKGDRYGNPTVRERNLRRILGDALDEDLELVSFDEELPHTLADSALTFMEDTATNLLRPGGFLEAFRLIYTDTSTMVTVGGVLPAKGSRVAAEAIINSDEWAGWDDEEIQAPLLTWMEASRLQQLLPREKRITKKEIRDMGFNLRADQLKSFAKYYRYYPYFAQIAS